MQVHPIQLTREEDSREAFYASLRVHPWMGCLFDSVPGAYFFVKDREGRFMDASESFAKIMGEVTVNELLGKTDFDYAPDFLAEAFVADDRRVMDGGSPIYNRIELVPFADGGLNWLCTSKVPLSNHEGRIIGLAGVTRVIQDSDKLYGDHPEMSRIVEFVKHHFRKKISVADMAAHAGISLSSQERLFKRIFGLSPLMYLRRTRLYAACRLLRETTMRIGLVAAQCGFSDQGKLSRAFRDELNITPMKYRRRYGGEVGRRSDARENRIAFPTISS